MGNRDTAVLVFGVDPRLQLPGRTDWHEPTMATLADKPKPDPSADRAKALIHLSL